jgi:hypothetical protein
MSPYKTVTVNGVVIYKFDKNNGLIEYQSAPYVDDGWIIYEDKMGMFSLHEGEAEHLVDQFFSLEEAHSEALKLT